VLRSKFDRWLAGKAEEEGAMLVPGIHVDRLLQEEGRTVGVAAGEEEIRANVVIVAEGANSFLVQQAGLRGRLPTDEVALGVKELIGLPREVLEDRFHLAGEEGTAYNIVGFATGGVSGGGFLYTNKESLSVGLVMQVKDLVASKRKPSDLMEEFLAHPMIAPLVKGGKLLEYGAHLVMEGGLEMMPRLYTDGLVVVGDAAGLSINNGFVVRGMDLAIGSAVAAADAITEANARKDFSAQSLSAYQAKLDQSYVMADMRTYARAPQFLTTERLYHEYPAMLTDLMTQIYSHEAQPKKHLMPILMQSLKDSQISFFELTRDVMNGVRAL
jgi:electron transfer flavoprotein-quinone oxidoreductase